MITETRDMDAVNSILAHPDIWADIAPEGVPYFDAPYLPHVSYFMVNDGDGVITFHPFLMGVKIHPNILPEKRGKAAYEAVEESIQIMFDRGYRSIYAEIPPRLKHVVRFAKALKFKPLGDTGILVRRKLDA